MNYKRKKPSEKKTIEYATPKEYKFPDDYKVIEHSENLTEYRAKDKSKAAPASAKKKFQCKALKGKHDFIRTGAEPVKFLNSNQVFIYEKCRGCFKQKIKTITRDELQAEKVKDESQMHIVH